MSVQPWLLRLRERVAQREDSRVAGPATHALPLSVAARATFPDARTALTEMRRRQVAVTVEFGRDGARWLVLRGGQLDADLIDSVADVRGELIRLLSSRPS